MADLPYFKFMVAEFLGGPIRYATLEAQGVFVNLCANLWDRSGVLKVESPIVKELLSKCQANAKQVLHDLSELDCIRVSDDGLLIIDFIMEQLAATEALSLKRSKAGRKGGKAKAKQKLSKCQANATSAYSSGSDSSSTSHEGGGEPGEGEDPPVVSSGAPPNFWKVFAAAIKEVYGTDITKKYAPWVNAVREQVAAGRSYAEQLECAQWLARAKPIAIASIGDPKEYGWNIHKIHARMQAERKTDGPQVAPGKYDNVGTKIVLGDGGS